jgi:hypothetical protein
MYLRNRSANAELGREKSLLSDCNLEVPMGFPTHNIVIIIQYMQSYICRLNLCFVVVVET